MNREMIKKRLQAIRHQLNKRALPGLIVTRPANVTYTTGFSGDDSWTVVAKRQVYLLTDSRYTQQAQTECLGCKIVERPNSLAIAHAAAHLVKKLKSIQTVAVEKSTSVADFELLKKNVKARVKTASNVIEDLRSSKDHSEVKAIKTAARIAAQALKQTLLHIKPGISENELAGLLNLQIRKHGAKNSFDTIVAFGPNASRPHHQPGKRKLKKTDSILIDFGARYNHYCCDITRCFAAGAATGLFKKAYQAVEKAQAAAIKMIKAGAESARVDAATRQVIAEHNLPVYSHGTGHGLGLEIHELPFVKAEGKGKLKAGQIITIEPGVYIPGKLGVRIEDDILVTETGCQILTQNCPHSPFLPNRTN